MGYLWVGLVWWLEVMGDRLKHRDITGTSRNVVEKFEWEKLLHSMRVILKRLEGGTQAIEVQTEMLKGLKVLNESMNRELFKLDMGAYHDYNDSIYIRINGLRNVMFAEIDASAILALLLNLSRLYQQTLNERSALKPLMAKLNAEALFCASCAGLYDYTGALPLWSYVIGPRKIEKHNTTWANVGVYLAATEPDIFKRQKEYIFENAKKDAAPSALKEMEIKFKDSGDIYHKLLNLTRSTGINYIHLKDHILKKDVREQREKNLKKQLYVESMFGNPDFVGVPPIKIPGATLKPGEHRRLERFKEDLEWYNKRKQDPDVGTLRRPRVDSNSFSLNLRDFNRDVRKSPKHLKYKGSGRTNNDKGRERRESLTDVSGAVSSSDDY